MPRSILGITTYVLVIDDGSTDGSGDVARTNGAFVARLPVNAGGGTALRTGFLVASANRAKAVVTMDGDGQHDPSQLESLLMPILQDKAEIVIGSRLLGSHERVSFVRSAGIRIFSAAINGLQGTRISDCSSGFRAIATSRLAEMTLVQEQYHTAELIIEAAKHKMRIAEVSIHIKRRMSGKSKKGRNVLYGIMFLRTIMHAWLR
jgi:glycosyltransferase involved in cell wall biosynthesis